MSVIGDIADGLVSSLNGLTLSQSYTAKRVALPRFALEDLAGLDISVWAAAEEISLESRSDRRHDYMVIVGIRKPIDPDSTTELDAMLDLVEELKDGLDFTAQSGATWIRTDHSPLFDPDVLQERREFLTSLEINYRKMR